MCVFEKHIFNFQKGYITQAAIAYLNYFPHRRIYTQLNFLGFILSPQKFPHNLSKRVFREPQLCGCMIFYTCAIETTR